MAFSKQTLPTNIGSSVIVDELAISTAQANVNGGAATIYSVMIDLTENTSEGVYLKCKNATSIASVAACQPDHQFYCPARSTMQYTIPGGLEMETGLSYYVSQEAGVGGTTRPSGIAKIYIAIG